MRKIVLCPILSTLLLSACAASVRTRLTDVSRIVMRDADDFVLIVRDPATGALRPHKFRAEHVTIMPDAPSDGAAWAEHVDRPGDWPGEGDSLVLHVHSIDDIGR